MSSSSDAMVDKIGEALKTQRFQMLEDIARELQGDVVFPVYFDAAFRLRKELQDPGLPIARVAKIVSIEPLVATKLMHLANSVLYSPGGEAARDLQAAIARLGVDLVRTTALAIAMNQVLRSKDILPFNDLARVLWNHTLKTAAAARILARSRSRINPDEALLAGLVHDLGAFYMLYRAAQYPELCSRPESVKHLIMQWHEGIGITLLGALGMPEAIVDSTIDHDQPRPLPEAIRTLADVVYVANILAGAHLEWFGQDIDPTSPSIAEVFEQYGDLVPEIEADTQEMLALFS